MFWKRIRIALLAGALAVTAGFVFADEKTADAPKGGEKEPIKTKPTETPPAAAPAPSPCGSSGTTTVWVSEMVPETYTATRTVYRQETKNETYTTYKTECVPETRTRNVTTYKSVTETVMECRTVCVSVPCTEQKTIMKSVTVCKPVTTISRKCEDHGHYECHEVECGPSLLDRSRGLFSRHGKSDCCDPCNTCAETCTPVRTKTVKTWVPCKVWVETPCTKMEKFTECHPEVITVNTCRKEMKTEMVPVCKTRCIPETHCETYTVNVSRCVPCTATRCVTVCVPVCETYTATRMVCRKVAKEVPVTTCDSCSTCGNVCDTCSKKKLCGGFSLSSLRDRFGGCGCH